MSAHFLLSPELGRIEVRGHDAKRPCDMDQTIAEVAEAGLQSRELAGHLGSAFARAYLLPRAAPAKSFVIRQI